MTPQEHCSEATRTTPPSENISPADYFSPAGQFPCEHHVGPRQVVVFVFTQTTSL
jgi:hypothetical protein